MAELVRPFRGVSATDRIADRRTRLIAAGLDVLGTEGFANFTMTAVCRTAGLNERYFYESFKNRDELIVAVYESVIAEGAQIALTALAAAPPDLLARTRAVAKAVTDLLADDPRHARVFLEAGGTPALLELRTNAIQALAFLLTAQFTELHNQDLTPFTSRLQAIAVVIIGGTAELVSLWLKGLIALTRDELVDECAGICVAAIHRLTA
jgi:AcrR family transcriptional regulator